MCWFGCRVFNMRKILSALFALFGAAGLMMQVGPHDAATNFCNWLSFWPACPLSLSAWFDRFAWAFPVALLCVAAVLLITPLAVKFLRTSAAHIARAAWKTVPVTELNLAAYIRSSPLVQMLDDQIAQIERLPIKQDETTAFPEQENAKLFGISNIAKLDRLLEENREAVTRMSSYGNTGADHIPRGASIMCLFDVLGAQLGEKSFRDLNKLRRFSRLIDDGVKIRLEAYREFSKNHKIKVRVPLVPDFNLVPIEEGLSLARKRCARSAFARTLPKGGSTENELLAYFERLKNKMAFYGKLRGRSERAPLGINPQSEEFPPPGFPFSSAVLNPRFEAGNIVVDSQLFRNDGKGNLAATDVTYDRLYVLRPVLDHAIQQLNEAKR
jgi:hypothetical protein